MAKKKTTSSGKARSTKARKSTSQKTSKKTGKKKAAKKTAAKKSAKKKSTARGASARKPARKKSTSAPSPASEQRTEIVFSYGEIDFLRKITGRDVEGTAPRDRRARLALRDKLLDIKFNAAPSGSGGLIVLELGRPEVGFLQRITKEVYSFITAEERRARLILREKILIGYEKVTGTKPSP